MKSKINHNRATGAGVGTFVRASSMFTASRFLGAFIGVLRGFFVARWLGPTAFGTWQFLNIFAQYGQYAGLSTRAAISREIPFLRGRGDGEQLHIVLGTACMANILGPLFYGVIVLGCSFFVAERFEATALAVFAPVIVLSSGLGYGKTLALAIGLYDVRTKLGLLEDILTGLLVIAFVYFLGLYGVIAGFGLAALIVTAYAVWKLWQSLVSRIDWRVLWGLIVVGLPLMANPLLLTAMAGVDQILIAVMLSREMLGVYGLARASVVILQTIPSSIGQMLFVKFAEMDGERKPNSHLAGVLNRSTLVLSVVFAPILAAAIATFPVVVVYLLPDYVSAIAPGRFLMAGVFFLGLSLPSTNWCMSTKRFRPVLTLRLIIVAAESAAIYLAISKGAGLDIVALLSLCAFAVFSVAMVTITNYLLGNPLRGGIAGLLRSAACFASVAVVILTQDYFLSDIGYVPGTYLLVSCSVALLVGVAVGASLLFATNRYTRLADLVRGVCYVKDVGTCDAASYADDSIRLWHDKAKENTPASQIRYR